MSRKILAKDIGLKFQRTTKKKTVYRKSGMDEKTIQAQCESYLDSLGIEYLHIPAFILNSAFGFGQTPSGPAMGAMRLAKQYVTGFPDLCIFHPDRKQYLAVELKTDIGKMRDLQKQWQHSLDTKICRSFEEFKVILDAWRQDV